MSFTGRRPGTSGSGPGKPGSGPHEHAAVDGKLRQPVGPHQQRFPFALGHGWIGDHAHHQAFNQANPVIQIRPHFLRGGGFDARRGNGLPRGTDWRTAGCPAPRPGVPGGVAPGRATSLRDRSEGVGEDGDRQQVGSRDSGRDLVALPDGVGLVAGDDVIVPPFGVLGADDRVAAHGAQQRPRARRTDPPGPDDSRRWRTDRPRIRGRSVPRPG